MMTKPPYFLAPSPALWLHEGMMKACLIGILFSLLSALPVLAYDWEATRYEGRDYVTLHSFADFYKFGYQRPNSSDLFRSSNGLHTLLLKPNSAEAYLDGVHYVLSFPIVYAGNDLLVSRLDIIRLFDPILRPEKIPGRHSIRGIVLDPGHGGTDNGAVSPYTRGMEKRYTLDTALRVEDLLRNKYDLKVILTRRTDVFIDLYERAHIASLYPDYAFVSIHFNSASQSEPRGLETYCLSPAGAASSSSNYLTRSDATRQPGNGTDLFNILLASCVHSEIIKLNPGDSTADRGVKRARFAVLRVNSLPSILVEGGFVSNRMESATLNTEKYRQRLAESVARGIAKFVALMGGHSFSEPDNDQSADETATTPVVKAPAKALALTPADRAGLAKLAVQTGLPPKKEKKGSAKAVKPALATVVPAKKPAADISKDKPATSLSAPAAENNAPLNLQEPAPAPPTPGAEKAPPEPDEPPVAIYPASGAPENAHSAETSSSSKPPAAPSPETPSAPKATPGVSSGPAPTFAATNSAPEPTKEP